MNTLKFITPIMFFAAIFASGFWLARAGTIEESGPPIPPISRVQAMSDLATQRVQITDSVTGENEHWLVRWLLHGEAVLGVDLSQAKYSSVDEKDRKATLSLPAAHVISSKVDHHRSAEMSVKRKTWIPLSGLQSLREEVWQSADEKVGRLANHEGYMEATKLQAERVLDKLYQDVGWSVSYQWESTSSPGVAPDHGER